MEPEKMSKSNNTESSVGELSVEVKMEALRSEMNYWKTRYDFLKKYGLGKSQ